MTCPSSLLRLDLELDDVPFDGLWALRAVRPHVAESRRFGTATTTFIGYATGHARLEHPRRARSRCSSHAHATGAPGPVDV
jgi:hypothetical protein